MNCDIRYLVENSRNRLTISRIKETGKETVVVLTYNGFFHRDAARLEGRRILGLLGRCYKFRFKERMTLFGYQVYVYLERK